jgi:hypothetical protein
MIVTISVVVFVLAIVVLSIIWVVTSFSVYTNNRLYPGKIYTVGNRCYTLPNVKLHGTAWLLRESFFEQERDLIVRSHRLLNRLGIPFWIAGGTLLGFVRHGTFIPWDDDIDVHTMVEHREYLFSQEFCDECNKVGLEAILMRGMSSLQRATKEGAAVRLRLKGTQVPIMDIFFETVNKTTGLLQKIDSWSTNSNGKIKYHLNTKEVWPEKDIFPLNSVRIDGLTLNFPAHPENLLKQQYGDNALTEMYARNIMFCHQFPFKVLNKMWTTSR